MVSKVGARPGDLKLSVHMLFSARFRGNTSDFRSDDSFPVKTGSRPTAMINPSFDADFRFWGSLSCADPTYHYTFIDYTTFNQTLKLNKFNFKS